MFPSDDTTHTKLFKTSIQLQCRPKFAAMKLLIICCCCLSGLAFAKNIRTKNDVSTTTTVPKQLQCTLGVCQLTDDSLKFFVIGDWGGQDPRSNPKYPYYYTFNQIDNNRAMTVLAKRYKTHFQVSIGDNFYTRGPTSLSDPRFNATFEGVYTDASLRTPWYITAGNHDYYGNVSVQIEYTKHSTRWAYPDFYYKVDYKLQSGTWIRLIMIDTIILCGNTDTCRPSIFPKDCYAPYEPKNKTAAEKQWRWIETTLNESANADFIFIAGHYPLYSAAEHGQTKCLVDRLEPLMHRHKVNAYMFGHSHSLEHLTRTRDGWTVQHILSGAGCSLNGQKTFKNEVSPATLQFYYPSYDGRNSEDTAGNTPAGGFVYTEVNRDFAKFYYYQSQRGLIYTSPSTPCRHANLS